MKISRRDVLKASGATAGMALAPTFSQAQNIPSKNTFRLSLNLSTIMGQNLGFIKELEVASQAGFRSVEIWMPTLEKYLASGGTIVEAKKRIADLGLTIENAIGFAQWIVDDTTTRSKGIEQLKREMGLLAELGCKRTAAPPMGATAEAGLNLKAAAERYRTILELGEQMNVIPQLEMWGHSKNLHRVADVLFVAAESGHKKARLLLDVFHIYKGGSSHESLHLVGENSIEIFHINDYVTSIKPDQIKDADRIYAGDGEAPIDKIVHALKPSAQPVVLSLELFNKQLYTQDPLLVAKTGLEKMKAVVKRVNAQYKV
ncbi:TIM barrel protein [Aquirufa nivalisilvae]|uniref:TIM barrel protein n=1 Tax=Aquirufa nivalisilvae TaxID=2516557 RepID=UPI001032D414|nr:TIM barrel protein [Aquirufa nivalisilvae]TBH76137.1 twin-arginine translocation signal domain-containing protein [Aquirufa nivalisilvae]